MPEGLYGTPLVQCECCGNELVEGDFQASVCFRCNQSVLAVLKAAVKWREARGECYGFMGSEADLFDALLDLDDDLYEELKRDATSRNAI